jgi:hypothetical protein
MPDTIYGASPIKNATNKRLMEYAATEGAQFREKFDKGFWDSVQMNPDGSKSIDFVGIRDAIANSAKGTKLDISDMLEKISAIEQGDGGFDDKATQIRSYVDEISKRSMGAVIDDMDISDDMKAVLKD